MQTSFPLGCAVAHAFSSAAWHLGVALGGGLAVLEQKDAASGVEHPFFVKGLTLRSTQRSQAVVAFAPLSAPQACARAAEHAPGAAAEAAVAPGDKRRKSSSLVARRVCSTTMPRCISAHEAAIYYNGTYLAEVPDSEILIGPSIQFFESKKKNG
jgi:hypothetical protein